VEAEQATEEQIASVEPQDEVGPADHEVGVADTTLRQLAYLRHKCTVRRHETIMDLMVTGSRHLLEDLAKLECALKIIDDIFQASALAIFDLWGKYHVQLRLRKGWKVVWSDPKSE